MTFLLYTTETEGASVFSETQKVMPDSAGIYNVLIGATANLGDLFDQDLWIEVTVGETTLSPRYRLTSSPYALRSAIANDVPDNVITTAKITDGTITNADIASVAAIQFSKLEKDPSQSGTINISTNPVDWTQLKNVPAVFADGTDDGASGTTIAVQDGDVDVDVSVSTMDFLGAQFSVTSSPAGEANISLDVSSVTLQGNTFNGNSRPSRVEQTQRSP